MCRRRDQLCLQPDRKSARFPAHHAELPVRVDLPGRHPGRGRHSTAADAAVTANSSTARSTPRPTKGSTTASQKGSGASSPSAIWCAGTTSVATWCSPIARLRAQTVFGTTQFPGEDEPSQYDLDVHSILDWPDLDMVVVLNHFGAVRGFRRADILGHSDGSLIEPASLWWFVADVERTVGAAGRLIGSAPRSDGAIGMLVSASLDAVSSGGEIPTRLCATAFGEVTALGVVPSIAEPAHRRGRRGQGGASSPCRRPGGPTSMGGGRRLPGGNRGLAWWRLVGRWT